MTIDSGTVLRGYRILELIGAGGMGEMYRAIDTRLGRVVAVKVLPGPAMADHGRRRRFLLEARVASAIDHPNVVPIFDIGERGGQPFIVMPFVEGKTLRTRLFDWSFEERLDLAMQIVDGVSAAHARGIVHRDLKPDNILVTDSGTARILDFGLATMLESYQESPTFDAIAPLTREGQLLGTAGYMSPEQLEGRPADVRSDIFSLGSILHELFSTRRAFDGGSVQAVLAAVLRDQPPPLRDLVPRAPPELEDIVTRALRKDPDERWQSASDLREALEHICASPLPPPRSSLFSRSFAVSVAVAIVAFGAWRLGSSRSAHDTAAMRVVPLTSLGGRTSEPAISPDGRQVAFTWDGANDGYLHVYVSLLGQSEPLQLTASPASDSSPAWSPTGGEVAFLRENGSGHDVLVVSALGGKERRLTSVAGARHGLDWSLDGRTIALVDRDVDSERDAIFLLDVRSGRKSRLSRPPETTRGDSMPRLAPGGGLVAFLRHSSGSQDVYVQGPDDAEARRLTSENSLIADLDWTSDGEDIVVARNREGRDWRLWRLGATGGALLPLPIGEHARGIAVAASGDRLVYSQVIEDLDLYRAHGPRGDPTIAPHRFAASSTRVEGQPQYAPDGERVAFFSDRSGREAIWVCDADGRNCLRITPEEDFSLGPFWSNDGSKLVYHRWSEERARAEPYVVDSRGGVPSQALPTSPEAGFPACSTDDRLIYGNSFQTGRFEIWSHDMDTGEARQLTREGGFRAWPSRDGQFVYFSRLGDGGVWRIETEGEAAEPVVAESVTATQWTLWDNSVIYLVRGEEGSRVEMMDLTTRTTSLLFTLGPEPRSSIPHPWAGLTVSPDGRWLLYTKVQSSSDLLVIEHFR